MASTAQASAIGAYVPTSNAVGTRLPGVCYGERNDANAETKDVRPSSAKLTEFDRLTKEEGPEHTNPHPSRTKKSNKATAHFQSRKQLRVRWTSCLLFPCMDENVKLGLASSRAPSTSCYFNAFCRHHTRRKVWVHSRGSTDLAPFSGPIVSRASCTRVDQSRIPIYVAASKHIQVEYLTRARTSGYLGTCRPT